MKKKKFLTMCAVLALTGSTAYGYDSRHYTVNEDLTWHEVTSSHVPPGGSGIWAFGGDSITIADGKKLTFDYAGGGDIIPGNFPGGLALYISHESGDWTQDLNVKGGTLAVLGTGNTKTGYGGYIREGATGKIIIDGTDLNFHDLKYGFKLNASETRIKNNQLNLVNDYYGVYTLNDAKFVAESKYFSAVNGELGLYSAGQGSISVTASDTALFQNNTCAVYTNGEGTAELKGNKLQMIDNNYGVSSSGKSVTIDVDEFTFGTSMSIDFPITAIYGDGNTKVDVTAGKAKLNGQIKAQDNAEIQFLEDSDAGNDQLIIWTLLAGGKGGIAGCANVYPHTLASIYDLYKARRIEEAIKVNESLSPFRALFRLGNPNTIVKKAVQLLGYDVGECRAPFNRLDTSVVEMISSCIESDMKRGLR